MNFLHHYKGWIRKLVDDDRLTPHHVCLYYALLESWNLKRFRNPLTIVRAEILNMAKIGSINTYTRCLKELSTWGYIRYEPSFNPQQGSKVHLYRFDKGGDKGTSKGSDKGAGKGGDKATSKASDKGTSKGGDKGRATYYKTIPNSKNNKNILNEENGYGTRNETSDFVNGGE